jgi:hypothetical protein
MTAMLLLRSFCIAILALAPLAVLAASPLEDFNNDALVAAAAKDILGMPRPELDTFIAHLASCGAGQAGSMKDFFCEHDRQLFLIKFARGRSIDRMIRVLAVMEKYQEALDRTAKPNTKERAELGQAIVRFVEIRGRFEDAASLRSQELIKEGR